MQKIHYAFSGFRYHKKMALTLLVLTGIFLVSLTFYSGMIQMEKINFSQLEVRIDSLGSVLSNETSTILKPLLTRNQQIIEYYKNMQWILLGCFALLYIVIQIFFLKQRNTEIKSLYLLKGNARPVLVQFIFELFFPLFLCFTLTLALLFIFQSNFWQLTNESNWTYATKESSDYKVAIFKEKKESADNSSALFTFNNNSLFTVSSTEHPRFSVILHTLLINFSILLLILFFCTSITTMAYVGIIKQQI